MFAKYKSAQTPLILARMNKKQGIFIGIAFVLISTGIAIATSTTLSPSSDVIIYAFDQNPPGSDKGNEWVTIHNPSNVIVEIGNWTLQTADGERETIPEGTTFYPFAYYIYSPPYQWLDITCGNKRAVCFGHRSTFTFRFIRKLA